METREQHRAHNNFNRVLLPCIFYELSASCAFTRQFTRCPLAGYRPFTDAYKPGSRLSEKSFAHFLPDAERGDPDDGPRPSAARRRRARPAVVADSGWRPSSSPTPNGAPPAP